VEPSELGQASLDYGGGCLALTPALRQVEWPAKFWANSFGQYDGTTNPREFLHLYTTAMVAA
jgi:hypothetical protein